VFSLDSAPDALAEFVGPAVVVILAILLGGTETRQRRHTPRLIPTNLVGFREMDETVEKVSLTSWVDRRERDKLQELAIAGDRTLSAEVRRAVAKHIERAAPDPEDDAK
jgi:hypothetical protein